MNHSVIFIHGFGVMKDARGMFTELASALSTQNIECILVDLNKQDETGNIIVSPLSKQVELLKDVYQQNNEGIIDLICHSQGCAVAALANLPQIRKTLFLAPPTESSYQKSVAYFSKNPLTIINLEGTSKLARRDGTFTLVSSQYWKERETMSLPSIYTEYAKFHDVQVVKAILDEVVSNDNMNQVFSSSCIHEISANHDFTGTARQELISLCQKLLEI